MVIREALAFFKDMNFKLPLWAYWGPDDWKKNKNNCEEIFTNQLGWDLTDFGSGDFNSSGLLLFTIRNGNIKFDQKPYAEKIMISLKDQVAPMHRHVVKAEDIINRGGGRLAIELYASAPDGSIDEKNDISVRADGIVRTVKAGGVITLDPGESVTLMPGDWHAFRGEGDDVLIGEVSTVNDDETDNIFREPIGRFAEIDEDEPME